MIKSKEWLTNTKIEIVRRRIHNKVTAILEVLATVLSECIEIGEVPGWLVEGRTILVMKDPKKDTKKEITDLWLAST